MDFSLTLTPDGLTMKKKRPEKNIVWIFSLTLTPDGLTGREKKTYKQYKEYCRDFSLVTLTLTPDDLTGKKT